MCVSVFIYGYTLTHPWSVPFFVSVLTPPKKKKKKHKVMFQNNAPGLHPFTNPPFPRPYPFSALLDGFEILRCKESEHLARLPWFLIHRLCGSHLLLGSLSLGLFLCGFLEMFRKFFPPRFREGRWFFGEQEESPKIWGTPRVFGVQVEMLHCLASRRHQKRRGCYRRTCSPSLPKRCFDKFDKVQLTMQVLSSIYITIELSSSFVPGKSPPKKKV